MTQALNWNDIDTVLLDMDGTLLDLHFDNFFWEECLPREYARHHGVDETEALEKMRAMYADKHGSLEWYSIDYWQDNLQLDIMTLKQAHAHLIEYRPYCLDFLTFLRRENKTPVLVTNAHPKSLALKMQICPLENHIPQRFSSHQFQRAKEHPDFWYRFEKAFIFDKSRSLFIDDNDAVLANAEKYGIAQLRSIRWPDAKSKTANLSHFPMIDSFQDIITT